ncbi:hypothetical protein EFT54_12855 [Lacticaseibacillus paracasei]|nr:hypothetical protein [Lacticaseibacillus paracasei]
MTSFKYTLCQETRDCTHESLQGILLSKEHHLRSSDGQYNHLKTAVKGTFTVFLKSPIFV